MDFTLELKTEKQYTLLKLPWETAPSKKWVSGECLSGNLKKKNTGAGDQSKQFE